MQRPTLSEYSAAVACMVWDHVVVGSNPTTQTSGCDGMADIRDLKSLAILAFGFESQYPHHPLCAGTS